MNDNFHKILRKFDQDIEQIQKKRQAFLKQAGLPDPKKIVKKCPKCGEVVS